jgi:hypothetical protein
VEEGAEVGSQKISTFPKEKIVSTPVKIPLANNWQIVPCNA